MTRTTERLIDLAATLALLAFAYMVQTQAPEISGAIAIAAVGLWLRKNAVSPDSPEHTAAAAAIEAAATLATARVEAAATAAAEVIKTAQAAVQAKEPH